MSWQHLKLTHSLSRVGEDVLKKLSKEGKGVKYGTKYFYMLGNTAN